MSHLKILSNGMGSQSMMLLALREDGKIEGDISITSDTGSENDCLWSDGRRTNARIFFQEVIAPYAERIGIKAAFPRTLDKNKQPYPPLHEYMRSMIGTSEFGCQPAPLFGNRGGRLRQVCTDRWKLQALRQEARRQGATTALSAIAIHYGEQRRISGKPLGKEGVHRTYQTGMQREDGSWDLIRWMTHYYPLIKFKMTREDSRRELDRRGIKYLVSSECDHCPHKDADRWLRTSPEMLQECADLEAVYEGKFFLTPLRIPLLLAVEQMKKDGCDGDADFGCENNFCGI